MQVAWCVARTSNILDPMDPMVYDKVMVNEGSAWNPDNNTVVIPYTGYYLIHYGVGTETAVMVSQYLYSFEDRVNRLVRDWMGYSGTDCLGKTIIRRFEAGTVLRIKTASSSTISSDLMQTTFMGLLIHVV